MGASAQLEIINGTNCGLNQHGYCSASATFALESVGGMYAVVLEYNRDDFSLDAGNFVFNFRSEKTSFSDMIPFVFPSIGMKIDALDILVLPSTVQVASSIAFGSCLTLATAGMLCQFSLSVRDAFGSSSALPSDFSILTSSFDDASFVSGSTKMIQNSTALASYVPSLAGYHVLSLFFMHSSLQWTLFVQPAPLAEALESFVKGSALSIATAGVDLRFTIFAIDAYGNMMERTNNLALSIENDLKTEYHSLPVYSNRAINTMVFKDITTTYRLTLSGCYRLSVTAVEPGLSMLLSAGTRNADALAPFQHMTTVRDISLESYNALGQDLNWRENITFSQISFSGFISVTKSGIYTFKVLTGSISDAVYLSIDRIKLVDGMASNEISVNRDLLVSANDAVLRVNWPESSPWSKAELWSPSASAYYFSDINSTCANAAGIRINGNGSWCTASGGTGQTMIIDAGSMMQITGVATQGRSDADQWVTMFSISISENGIDWMDFGSYPGNNDRNTIAVASITPAVYARFVKITIQEANGWSSMRAGLQIQTEPLVYPAAKTMNFLGSIHTTGDAGLKTWNTHSSGFSVTAAFSVDAMTGDQSLIHFFNSSETRDYNIVLELVWTGNQSFDIRFYIYNAEIDELNRSCSMSPQVLGELFSKYVITATYDPFGKVSKIYVDGILRKSCLQGTNAASGPRTLQFSYLGKSSTQMNFFNGKLFFLAVFDRCIGAEEAVDQHQALKGMFPIATIALTASSLYEFELSYSAVSFSRIEMLVRFIECLCLLPILSPKSYSYVVVIWRILLKSSSYVIFHEPVPCPRKSFLSCCISLRNLRLSFNRFWIKHNFGNSRIGFNIYNTSSRFSRQCKTRFK
jgi:hypothetical protein